MSSLAEDVLVDEIARLRAQSAQADRVVQEMREDRDMWHREALKAHAALGQIARMKLFPDDIINRTTLQAAIALARKTTETP